MKEERKKVDNLPICIVLYASKYKLYMAIEEEFKRELAKEQEILEIEKRLER